MLRNNKTMSIVMALCLCLALLAPVLVVAPADAASATITVESSQTVTPGTLRDLGVIKVTIPSSSVPLLNGDELTVTFPTEVLDEQQLYVNNVLQTTRQTRRLGSSETGDNVPVMTTYTDVAGTEGSVQVVVPASATNPLVGTEQGAAAGIIDDATVAADGDLDYVAGTAATNAVSGVATNVTTTLMTNSKFTVKMPNAATITAMLGAGRTGDATFYIYLHNLDCTEYAGDVTVSLVGQSGSLFPSLTSFTVGTVTSTGATVSSVKSVANITSGSGGAGIRGNSEINTITTYEKSPGSISLAAGNIELKIMTRGYSWNVTNSKLLYDWGYSPAATNNIAQDAKTGAGLWTVGGTNNDTITMVGQINPTSGVQTSAIAALMAGGDTATVAATAVATTTTPATAVTLATAGSAATLAARTTAAAILVGGTKGGAGLIHMSGLNLNIDDTVAKVGQDVEVRARVINAGAVNGFTEQTFVVAKYIDFGANVLEGTTTELISGTDDQKIGEFYIEESAPGSLIQDRTVTLTLPEGYVWDSAKMGAWGTSFYEVVNGSNIVLAGVGALGGFSDEVERTSAAVPVIYYRTLKLNVQTASDNALNGAKIKFKNLLVMSRPDAKGDVVLEVGGKAGVEGTVKVATCTPIVTLETNPKDVALGIQEQTVGDITIKEAKAGALFDLTAPAGQNQISLTLDEDFEFAKTPTVTLESGDMVLNTAGIRTAGDRDNGGQLIIPIKAGSYKTPAVIKISKIVLTANRNAPEGPLVVMTSKATNNAFNSTSIWSTYKTTSATIANNKSVPPNENQGAVAGGTAEFKLASNIYKVNGMSKVMDASPYVKNGRTYVPLRYLGYALGMSDSDIVWDSAAQTATFTKGDKKVVLTINSTTMTVNGESKTIDVAPELSGDRTMLPARFVAEAFGAQVGWDQPSQTVVIEN